MPVGQKSSVLAVLVFILVAAGCGGGASTVELAPGDPVETVAVGETFEFVPDGSGPAGDEVVYSVSNKPPWADFDEGSGRLEGTPPPGSEGVYAGIIISADDGTNSTSVTLTIEVISQGTASITLSWTPPVENEDGSVLTDLAGYVIYYGTSPGRYDSSVEITNAGLTTYVLEGLTPGTYYLVASAVNSAGIESRNSNAVTREAT